MNQLTVALLLWALTATATVGTHILFRPVREAAAPVGRVAVEWPPQISEPRFQRLADLEPPRPPALPPMKVRPAGDVALEGEPLRP